MQSIVYVTFGDDKYKYELLYNLKSLFENHKLLENQQIIIICDDANVFEQNGFDREKILLEVLSKEIFQEWLGKEKFLFRVKIKAIEYVLGKYKGAVLYLDTDIVILNEITPLLRKAESSIFLLNSHACISKQLNCYYKIRKLDLVNQEDFKYFCFLEKQYKVYTDLINGMILNDFMYQLDLNFSYCNAGCIGINENSFKLLDEVCKVSDQLFLKYHYELSEELAFNIVFQRQKNYLQIETDNIIFHYSSFEYKICRLLSGYVGKCLSKKDYYEFQKILEKGGIKCLKEYDLQYSDISKFAYFLNEFGLLNGGSENSLTISRFMLEKELRPTSNEYLKKVKKYYKIYKVQNKKCCK